MLVNKEICAMCGNEIDPKTEKLGHIDDHMVICNPCYPKYVKKIVKGTIMDIGKHLSRWYRLQKGSYANEKGFTIVLAIGILAILTIIGVSAVRMSNTEQKVSTNGLIYNINFYAAESGIAVSSLVAKSTQLDADWEDVWPIEGDGILKNCSYTYSISKLEDIPESLPDIKVLGEGESRNGISSIEATFKYNMSLSPLSAALTVNGGVAKNNEKEVRADDIKGNEIDSDIWDIATTGSLDNMFVTNKNDPSAILDGIIIYSNNITAYDGLEFNMPDENGDDRLCKVMVVPDDGDVDDGCGVLFVDGSTTTNGSFSWDGIVIIKEKWKKNGFSGDINGAVVVLNESGNKTDLSFIMSAETGYSITWNAEYIKAAQHAISSYHMTNWKQI